MPQLHVLNKHTYTHACIHTYVHMDDAWMHTYVPDPRPNDSPIEMQRTPQTEITEDEEKPATGSAKADDADEGDEGEGDEEELEDDPDVDEGEGS